MDIPVIYDSTITTTGQHAANMLADRDLGHRAVMELWGQHGSNNARSKLGVLWAVTSADLAAHAGTVHVRSNIPPEQKPSWQRDVTTTRYETYASTGTSVDCCIELAAQKSPSVPMPEDLRRDLKAGADGTPKPPGQGKCWRPNRVRVPDNEIHQWAEAKLIRNGLQLYELNILRRHNVRLAKRHASYPVVKIHAKGTVTDVTAWHHALSEGIGKGKSFGTGLVIQNEQTP